MPDIDDTLTTHDQTFELAAAKSDGGIEAMLILTSQPVSLQNMCLKLGHLIRPSHS